MCATRQGLDKKFVVMHSGNVGHAQDLDTLVRSATFLRDLDDLTIAIIGHGARHDELVALREEAESLAEALAARKAIERAKGLLMEKEGLSEDEAFSRLRKASQVSGRPLNVVAEALLATFAES